jgi:hypothetical protein
MIKIRNMLIMLLVATLLIIPSGCYAVETVNYDFDSDFNIVMISSAYKVEITQASSYSISVTVDADKTELIRVTKEGDQLIIGINPHLVPVDFHTLKAKITMPDIVGLTLAGATSCDLRGFSFSHEFSLNLSGASRLSGDLNAEDVHFLVSGASTLQLKGTANDMLAYVSGASNIDLSSFELNNANISLDGASNGTVNLDGTLDASLSGASKLTYKGNPTLGNIDISGSSTINKG